MSYDVPITITQQVTNSISRKVDDEIYKAVLNIGVDVDRDELLRALNYDRQQYQKGYDDRDSELVHCEECIFHVDELFCKSGEEEITVAEDICVFWGNMAHTTPRGFCHNGDRRTAARWDSLEKHGPMRVAGFKFTEAEDDY